MLGDGGDLSESLLPADGQVLHLPEKVSHPPDNATSQAQVPRRPTHFVLRRAWGFCAWGIPTVVYGKINSLSPSLTHRDTDMHTYTLQLQII